MDITGRWSFKEDFGFGHDSGVLAVVDQRGALSGVLTFTEEVEGDLPFSIQLKVEGRRFRRKVWLRAISVIDITSGEEDLEYNLDEWEGTLTSQGQIVGSSIDSAGVCGVFVLTPEHK